MQVTLLCSSNKKTSYFLNLLPSCALFTVCPRANLRCVKMGNGHVIYVYDCIQSKTTNKETFNNYKLLPIKIKRSFVLLTAVKVARLSQNKLTVA